MAVGLTRTERLATVPVHRTGMVQHARNMRWCCRCKETKPLKGGKTINGLFHCADDLPGSRKAATEAPSHG
jgi:hypothetical protein